MIRIIFGREFDMVPIFYREFLRRLPDAIEISFHEIRASIHREMVNEFGKRTTLHCSNGT